MNTYRSASPTLHRGAGIVPALAAVIALAVFGVDSLTHLDFAIAHRRDYTDGNIARCATSLVAIATTSLQALRNKAAIVTCGGTALRWLNRHTPELDEAGQSVVQVIRDAKRADEVIRRIRAMAQKCERLPVLLDLNDVVRESIRNAVSNLLRSVGLAVETFGSAREFLAYEMPDVPSCLILDVRLKGQSGLAVQERIAASRLDLPIIFMTAHGDIAMTVKAMKAGAADLRRCYESLTVREREVMAFVAAGLMNKQIAGELNLSEITVKIHRGQAMRKMGARSLADFVLKAEALGVNAPQGGTTPSRGSRN